MQREQGRAWDWLLTVEEHVFVTEKATRSRLGLALQLKFYQHLGRFPERLSDLPAQAADALAGPSCRSRPPSPRWSAT